MLIWLQATDEMAISTRTILIGSNTAASLKGARVRGVHQDVEKGEQDRIAARQYLGSCRIASEMSSRSSGCSEDNLSPIFRIIVPEGPFSSIEASSISSFPNAH